MKKITVFLIFCLVAAFQSSVALASAKELLKCQKKCKSVSATCVKNANSLYQKSIKMKPDARSKAVAKAMLKNEKGNCTQTRTSCLENCKDEFSPEAGE